MISVALANTDHDIIDARNLMRRYAQWTSIDLCFQSFATEPDELSGNYVVPLGALWLARINPSANPVGVIAVRPIDSTVCEMKRLWVQAEAQRLGLCGTLARTAIEFARAAGFVAMKLDTLRGRMPAAIALYRSLGFLETEPYTISPEPDVLYMCLNLRLRSP